MSKNKTLAKQFKMDCGKKVEQLRFENPISVYQDCVNVWMFNKLAELQTEINELKHRLDEG